MVVCVDSEWDSLHALVQVERLDRPGARGGERETSVVVLDRGLVGGGAAGGGVVCMCKTGLRLVSI